MTNFKYKIFGCILALGNPIYSLSALAAPPHCGGVDYSWGANALHEATTYVISTLSGTINILQAIASVVAIISALQITLKMNYHEGEITKNIVFLVGACIFLITTSIAMPAFFGLEYTGGKWELY